MPPKLPVFWFFDRMSAGEKYFIPTRIVAEYSAIELSSELQDLDVIFTEDHGPKYGYFRNHRVPATRFPLPDIFSSAGATLVSEAMRAQLLEFDLGETQFFEIPIYDHIVTWKEGNPVPYVTPDFDKPLSGRWFILNNLPRKNAFLPEFSTKLYQKDIGLKHKGVWTGSEPGYQFAVDADIASMGPDLWMDPKTDHTIYMSDRLKIALKAKDSPLKTGFIKHRRCKAVRRP